MIIKYEHIESSVRGYQGIALDMEECRAHLQGAVKDNLLDREERQHTIDVLRTLQQETGFEASGELIADIQALENEQVELQQFRIGEAYAEVLLKEEFG